jgi:hypothetical protein
MKFPRIKVFCLCITVPTDLDETRSLTKESSVDKLVGGRTLQLAPNVISLSLVADKPYNWRQTWGSNPRPRD